MGGMPPSYTHSCRGGIKRGYNWRSSSGVPPPPPACQLGLELISPVKCVSGRWITGEAHALSSLALVHVTICRQVGMSLTQGWGHCGALDVPKNQLQFFKTGLTLCWWTSIWRSSMVKAALKYVCKHQHVCVHVCLPTLAQEVQDFRHGISVFDLHLLPPLAFLSFLPTIPRLLLCL